MFVYRGILALSLVLGLWVAFPQAPSACDGVAAHRVKERPAGVVWGSKDLMAVGDFDGDGRTDRAFFLERSGALSLVACLGGGAQLSTILDLGGSGAVRGYGIKTVPRGVHPTFCGKGYGPDCTATQPAEMDLPHEAIELVAYERLSYLLYRSGSAWKRIAWSG